MLHKFNPKFPSVSDLRAKAKMKMPKFAFEYLDGGCNDDHNLRKNTSELRAVELIPEYLKSSVEVSLKTKLFGVELRGASPTLMRNAGLGNPEPGPLGGMICSIGQ